MTDGPPVLPDRVARALDEVAGGLPTPGRPLLVGVDGVDGSGKTTVATALAERVRATDRPAVLVHLDDFLHPRAVRWRQGRHSPEGFVADTYDLQAVARLVLDPLRGPAPVRIVTRSFDHRTDAPVSPDPVPVATDAVVLVEGMFLHREELRDRWDLSLFLDVPFAVSVARLAARDGSDPDPEHPSLHRYVAGQRLYLEACRPRQRADVVLVNA